jgi:trans-aconitate methyltransferase
MDVDNRANSVTEVGIGHLESAIRKCPMRDYDSARVPVEISESHIDLGCRGGQLWDLLKSVYNIAEPRRIDIVGSSLDSLSHYTTTYFVAWGMNAK